MILARLYSTLCLIIFIKVCHGQLGLLNQPGLCLTSLSTNPACIQQALQRKNTLIANPKSYNDVIVTKSTPVAQNNNNQEVNAQILQQQTNVNSINSQNIQLSQAQQNLHQPVNINSQLLNQQIMSQLQQQGQQLKTAQHQNSQQAVNLLANNRASDSPTSPQMLQDININSNVRSSQPSQTSSPNVGYISNIPVSLNNPSSNVGVDRKVSNDPSIISLNIPSQQNRASSEAIQNQPSQGQFTLTSIHLQPAGPIQQTSNGNQRNQPIAGPTLPSINQNQNTPVQIQKPNNQNQNAPIVQLQQPINQNQQVPIPQCNNPNYQMHQVNNQNQPITYPPPQSSFCNNQQGVQQNNAIQQYMNGMQNGPNMPLNSYFSPNQISNEQCFNNQAGFSPNSGIAQNGNQGSKSSGMKALLPLLLNMINDKGCGCRNCNNCGCPNNNGQLPRNMQNNLLSKNFATNNIQNKDDMQNAVAPQVASGYANAINYSLCNQPDARKGEDHCEEEYEESEEHVRKKKKHKKTKKEEEEEYDEYEDDYSCEEDDD